MDTISKPDVTPKPKKRLKLRPILASSQLRYAAAYILITFAVLFFLNIYANNTIRRLTFSSQRAAMRGKAQLIASSFSGYEALDAQTVGDVISTVNDLHAARVVVTDAAGYVLYDSLPDGVDGRLALYPELAEALSGRDVCFVRYDDGVLLSRAAIPIMSFNHLIGGVYLTERDADQGALIQTLQRNILWISLVLEGAIILFSLLIALLFSGRIRRMLTLVRQMHDGNYDEKIRLRGRDEMARLGSAFNDLADRLKQSEEVRKQFVSDASHELKTPLASIKLLTDSILQNDMDPATTREFVGDIGSEADRLTRLSEKLLELTRLDSAPADEKELNELGDVAGRVLRMLAPLAEKQQVSLTLETAAPATVLAPEDDLYQILFNLVENAIKYNRSGGAVLLRTDCAGDEALAVVEDTGVGIPESARPHVFERFYRVDKARSRRAGGAGLGLSIVHDMVARNDGTVEVAPRAGGGTRFTVRFPRFDVPTESTKSAAEGAPTSRPSCHSERSEESQESLVTAEDTP